MTPIGMNFRISHGFPISCHPSIPPNTIPTANSMMIIRLVM
jgi:hypothetical protein